MRFLHIISMSVFVKQNSEYLIFFYCYSLVFVTICLSVYDTFLKELQREEKIAEREGWQIIKWQLSDEGSCLETVCESHFFEVGLSINVSLFLRCLMYMPMLHVKKRYLLWTCYKKLIYNSILGNPHALWAEFIPCITLLSSDCFSFLSLDLLVLDLTRTETMLRSIWSSTGLYLVNLSPL